MKPLEGLPAICLETPGWPVLVNWFSLTSVPSDRTPPPNPNYSLEGPRAGEIRNWWRKWCPDIQVNQAVLSSVWKQCMRHCFGSLIVWILFTFFVYFILCNVDKLLIDFDLILFTFCFYFISQTVCIHIMLLVLSYN